MDKSTRQLAAAVLFVSAALLAANYIADGVPFLNWWLPLVLAVLGAALILPWPSRAVSAAPTAETVVPLGLVNTYNLASPAAPAAVPDEEEVIEAPETMTPPAAPAPAPEQEEVIEAPETMTPVAEPETAGETAEDILNTTVMPTDAPHDPLTAQMPVSEVKPEIEITGPVVQPANTAENEFQSGEKVASIQPPTHPPKPSEPPHIEGNDPLPPSEHAVLDHSANPPQSYEGLPGAVATDPEVADDVLNGNASTAEQDLVAPTDPNAKPDDLTLIDGIGAKMGAALVAAGIDSFAKLSQASQEDLTRAIEAAKLRFAPTMPTWAEQAAALHRGDKDAFNAIKKRNADLRKG